MIREPRKEEVLNEAELTLLQLHQVQEELGNVYLSDQAKQKQLEVKQQISAKSADLEAEKKGKGEAREEARAHLASTTSSSGGIRALLPEKQKFG